MSGFPRGARVVAARCSLCPRSGNGWARSSGVGFPQFQMVAAAAASLCACACACACVCVCVRTQGCRETLTSEGTTSPFLFNSSAHAQLLYGASFPSAPADHTGLLCTAPKRFFPSYTVLRGCRQSYRLSPPPFSFSSGLNQGSAVPPA